MSQAQTAPDKELIRLADLEWLDLSDLIRMDDEWHRTLVLVSRLHLFVTVVLMVVVIAASYLTRPIVPAAYSAAAGGLILCVAGMAYLILRAKGDEARMLQVLRPVVVLSIVAVSLMVFLLRELQGDYYLLYLLPLVSAAGYLGFTGGLLAGVVSAIAYAIVFFVSPVGFTPGALSALVLRALIFVLVASLLGLIAERHLSLLSALRASHMQAIHLAITDTKTGLFNQRFLQTRMRSEMARAERSKTPAAFLAIDVNGLEKINREYGYSAGDAVLQALGRIIQKQLRMTDVPSRWGVDEFGVFLYNCDAAGAEVVARRVAAELARESFTDPTTRHSFTATIAQGIAAFPTHTVDGTGAQLIDYAYQAMHRAKGSANGSIVIWSA